MLLGTALGWAASVPARSPSEELAHLAQALRHDPSLDNYQRLARFAAEYAESESSARAAFALGMADLEAKRWGPARERFRHARASRWLYDRAMLNLAQTELELGGLEAARLTLMELSFAGSPLSEPVRILEAERRVRVGEARAAVEWLAEQADVAQRPALLLALAKAQLAAAEPGEAAETLNRVYYEFPLSLEAEPSNALLAQLRTELKGNFPAPSETLRRMRADKLWDQQAYRGARSAYVDLSVRAREPTRSEARVRAALALYQLGAQGAACGELGKISQAPPSMEGEFRSYWVRCGLRSGTDAGVEVELAVLADQFAGTEWYKGALLAVGNAALVRGDATRARDAFKRLVERFPSGEAAAEAHWKLAWLAYQESETTAAGLLEEHFERFPESPFLPRALYWRARAALAMGAEPLAERLLAFLRDYAPRDYLAQQAEGLLRRLQGATAGEGALPAWLESLRQRLGPPATGSAATSELAPAARLELEKAAVFEELGFPELAGWVLEAAIQQGPHPELHLAQARLAFAQQNYARASEILRRAYPAYWRSRLEELPREAWEILFPRPYWELIEREAQRQGLDPFLVAGLIRQESRFERHAVSSAGALGLMQLMPATARRLAGARLSESRITNPEVNVRLGTRYLAELLRRFGGSREKAVAAYNAGGTRVEGWATQGGAREPAAFVESIPVTQTREFVYTVLRNYRFYSDLYSGQPPTTVATASPEPPQPER